jgi:hypothetical protein
MPKRNPDNDAKRDPNGEIALKSGHDQAFSCGRLRKATGVLSAAHDGSTNFVSMWPISRSLFCRLSLSRPRIGNAVNMPMRWKSIR